MLNNRYQRGMTMWGFMMLAVMFGAIVILTFKLLPPYMEYGKVKVALDNVAAQPEAANMDKPQVKQALDRRFSIDDVGNIDLIKALTVEKKPEGTTFRITYERRVPIAYNVTALIEFDHSAQAKTR